MFSELLSKFGAIWAHSLGHLCLACLQNKEGQMRSKFNLVGLKNSSPPSTFFSFKIPHLAFLVSMQKR